MENIYVIGHKNPDTDTILSAITMSHFLNAREKTTCYVPVASGKLNTETLFILEKFGVAAPPFLEDGVEKEFFLVDHNEPSQMIDGIEVNNVHGFVDHHKIKFECSKPIEIITRPWGCTNTIIYDLFEKEGIALSQELKGLMLCAILSDTVVLKSPTTTIKDKEVVEKLSNELGIDYQALGVEQFKAKAQVASKSAQEIIYNDFKEFVVGSGTFGVGQIETPDMPEVEARVEELREKMLAIKEEKNYTGMILMLTDIMKEGSKLLVVGDETKLAQVFETSIAKGLSTFLAGVMSRKKQIAPKLADHF